MSGFTDNSDELELEESGNEILEPSIDTDPRDLAASDLIDYYKEVTEVDGKRPNDVMLSGPIWTGWGPGRWHPNRRTAFKYLCSKFGEHRVFRTNRQTHGRWSFIIKDLKILNSEGRPHGS